MPEEAPAAALLLALAVTAHNLEEWIWLPSYPYSGPLRPPSPFAFRFAAAVVTVMFWMLALAIVLGFPLEAGLAGFALAMIVNAAVPHLAASIWFRRYHPGTATAWLLVVPACLNVLAAVHLSEAVREPSFLLGAAAGLIGLAVSVPLLIGLGRKLS